MFFRGRFPGLLICLSLLMGCLPGNPVFAQYHYDFNPVCQKAYGQIIALRLDSGKALIEAEKKTDPRNLIPYFLENYIDFFTLFFNEDPAEYQRRKPGEDQRLNLMKKGDPSSPFFLFTRSVIYFQWAAADIKFGNRWEAAWSFRRSFLNGKENLVKFPGFQPSRMLQGAMQVAAGTIPPGYQWLGDLLGIQGSIAEGMKVLENVLTGSDRFARLFHDEAVFYFLYLKFHIQNQPGEVFQYIRQHQLDTRNNHLFTYLAANLYRNNQQAASAEQVIRNRNPDPGYLDMPVWDLEMGYALADHLDPGAIMYLERFLRRFKGKFYVREVLQKLGWIYYLQGQKEKAENARARIFRMGNSETEADKQALKDAQSGRWPNELLLKARLLDDGGYFHEALQLLSGKSSSSFNNPADQLEFAYRLGRLYDALNRKQEAIDAYLTTIKLGEHRKEYYAARAALQTGYIYEARGDKKTAIPFFQKVLALKGHDYKNALDQKAKAAIERCNNG
ncbi:MAG TPA: tetratricopeptide repeat protein [Puia sp.]|jgi:tetratricopeptide (TPR) repeat protein